MSLPTPTPTPTPRAEPTFPPDPQLQSLIGWGSLIAGVALCIFMGVTVFDKFDAWEWPRARAQIVSSALYKSSDRSAKWCIKLTYRYTVDGRAFTGRRQATSWLSDAACDRSQSLMQARFAQQQPGAALTVRYRPGQPERAIVYADGMKPAEWFFVALTLVLVAGGVGGLRGAARLRLEAQAHAADRKERMRRAAALQAHGRVYSAQPNDQ